MSNTTAGFHIVGRYTTSAGALVVEIRISARTGLFSYTGDCGSGSGLNAIDMRQKLSLLLKRRLGVVAEIPFHVEPAR